MFINKPTLTQMADVYRGRPASSLWKAGMGGNEPNHQVLLSQIFLDDCTIHVQLPCEELGLVCLNTLFQISRSFMASRLPPFCGKHICWFQGLITNSK